MLRVSSIICRKEMVVQLWSAHNIIKKHPIFAFYYVLCSYEHQSKAEHEEQSFLTGRNQISAFYSKTFFGWILKYCDLFCEISPRNSCQHSKVSLLRWYSLYMYALTPPNSFEIPEVITCSSTRSLVTCCGLRYICVFVLTF